MKRKRLTQVLPWLLPLRQAQKKWWFYFTMQRDGRNYAKTIQPKTLPHVLFASKTLLINEKSGQDMVFQTNKIHNLKLAAAKCNQIVLLPHETFSFWKLVRDADQNEPYKEGLSIVDGSTVGVYGGGLCQLSNLLFWLFLHSPLRVVERHSHTIKNFPSADGSLPEGVDATVSEGWMDLKVINETATPIQIHLFFDETWMYGELRSATPPQLEYQIEGRNLRYLKEQQTIYQHIAIVEKTRVPSTDGWKERVLYRNKTRIGYALPEDMKVEETK